MSTPLISIIIPVYNSASTLQRAIESVLQQQYEKKELIIIDGESTDGSVEIVRSFGDRIACFISEKDNGVYSAINKGLQAAKGEWIYVVGADDRLADANVLHQIFAKEIPNAKLLFGDVKNEDVQHRLVPAQHKSQFDSSLYWRNTLHQQGAFYHRSVFTSFRFDESMRVLADYDLHLKLLRERTTFMRVQATIAICTAQGLSKNFSWSLYSEELRMKKRRLSTVHWLLNIPVVILKFLFKQIA